MSKKQKGFEQEVQKQNSVAQDDISQGIIETDKKKDKKSKDNANKKNVKKKEKKPGLIKKSKETISELKKVTWPSFGEVVKKTGVVIAFVLLFGVCLYGVNTLLGWLVSLLVG